MANKKQKQRTRKSQKKTKRQQQRNRRKSVRRGGGFSLPIGYVIPFNNNIQPDPISTRILP